MVFGESNWARRIATFVPSACLLAACAALTACNTTPTMDIPVAQDTRADFVRVEGTKPIAFERVVSGIRSGTIVAHYPADGVSGTSVGLCNYGYTGEVTETWIGASQQLSGWRDDLGIAFFDTMTGRGFDVTTDPGKLFNVPDEIDRAQYLIAARIDEMRGNFCEEHHWWDGRPLGKYAGEVYLDVTWSVYDVVQQREIAQFTSNGYFLKSKASTTGFMEAWRGAFAASADRLAGDADFVAAVSGKLGPTAQTADLPESGSAAPSSAPVFVLPNLPLSQRPFHEVSDAVTGSVVTVVVGAGGHGSGFVVREDGYILTNHHVVGEAETVRVRFPSGLEMAADVVRRHKVRDVALLRVPVSGLKPLPLHLAYPKVAAPVFVIGTPAQQVLEATVTRGIVSSIRPKGLTGREPPLIQADAAVHGGNSGGALVDENGNILGVTVAVANSGGQATDSLSLFIPIASALEYLNMTVDGSPPPS